MTVDQTHYTTGEICRVWWLFLVPDGTDGENIGTVVGGEGLDSGGTEESQGRGEASAVRVLTPGG